jgi:hypothetical protein
MRVDEKNLWVRCLAALAHRHITHLLEEAARKKNIRKEGCGLFSDLCGGENGAGNSQRA